jgi:hypothetical protein
VSDEAYQAGYEAERQGKGFFDNPYPDGTLEARRWVDGYTKSIIERPEEYP